MSAKTNNRLAFLLAAAGVALAVVGYFSLVIPPNLSQVWTVISDDTEIAGVQVAYGWILAASAGLLLIAGYLKSFPPD